MIKCVIFLLLSFKVLGQNYTLKSISVRNEQNTYFITSPPFIDRDGSIWYSTDKENVFYKFDGRNKIEYKIHNKDKKNPGNKDLYIFSWIQDFNGNIWAIGLQGYCVINPKTFKVTYNKWTLLGSPLPNPYDVASILDSYGNIWISISENYVIKFDRDYHQRIFRSPALPKDLRYIKYGESEIDAQKASLKIVQQISDDKILIKSPHYLYIIDKTGFHFYAKYKEGNKKILFSKNGTLFSQNTSGAYHIQGRKFNYKYVRDLDLQMFEFPNSNFLYNNGKIFTISQKKVYIGSLNKDQRTIQYSDTLVFKDFIYSTQWIMGQNDVIWFSTINDIFMLKTRDQLFKKHCNDNQFAGSITKISSDKRDNLYLLVDSKIIKYKLKSKSISKINDTLECKSLLIDTDSILWAAGYEGDIHSINLYTGKVKTRYLQPGSNIQLNFIKKLSEDAFWVGTSSGLFILNKESGQFQRLNIGVPYSDKLYIADVLKTGNGDLWIASDKGLLLKRRGEKTIDYSKNVALSGRKILNLYEDKNKNIWIGTNSSGAILLNYKTGKVEVYDQNSGLCNNNLCGILESPGKMWFSTLYGLATWNKKTHKFNNYYIEDGISDNQFFINSYCKSDNGNFYFGGRNGITEVNPENFNFKQIRYKIFISKKEYFSEIKNKNTTVYGANSQPVNIPYDKNYFSVEVAINDLYNNEKNTYQYRIKGLLNHWVDAGPSGIIKLYNLPAGDYILNIKGKDFQGNDTANQIEIKIHVGQIFFKTNYFIALLFLIFLFSLILAFKINARKLKKNFERKMEITTLKANALKAQMNPHFIFNILNNIQSVLLLKGEAEANKYFGAFSRLLRLTLDMSKQHMVTLEDELQYINYYLILNKLQLNDQLKFIINTDGIENKNDIFIPGMLIQPFVENSIIHGLVPKEDGEKVLEINCCVDQNYLIIIIKDNGIGRQASLKLKNKRNYFYKSWSTEIVEERIKVINAFSSEQDISFKIEDNFLNDVAVGTTVTIQFKITR